MFQLKYERLLIIGGGNSDLSATSDFSFVQKYRVEMTDVIVSQVDISMDYFFSRSVVFELFFEVD